MSESQLLDQQVEAVDRMLAFKGDIAQVNIKALLTSVLHRKGNSLFVDPERLRELPDFNPRVPSPALDAHIRNLADSMKEVGFKESKPLSCVSGYEGKKAVIYITDGHCRFRAAKLAISEGAKIQWLPVVIEDRTTTIEDLTVSLVSANAGKPLTVLEKAIVAKRLHGYKWSAQQIAHKLGFTVKYVNDLLMLSGAPLKIRQMIQEDQVTAAVAIETMRQHGSEATQILEGAVQVAMQSGKTRTTRKNMPQQIYVRHIRKVAPKLVTVIEKIVSDASFASLSSELQSEILDLVKQAEQAKQQADASVAATPVDAGPEQSAIEGQLKAD